MRPFLEEQGVQALGDCPAARVGRPAVTVGHRVALVEFGLDVAADFHAVDDQVRDQAVDLPILHHDPDEPRAVKHALAELRTGQLPVDEAVHAARLLIPEGEPARFCP